MDGRTALRQNRREANFTQAQLAYILGVSSRTIIRWEKGDTQPSLRQAGVLEWLLDVRAGSWTSTEDIDRARTRRACLPPIFEVVR